MPEQPSEATIRCVLDQFIVYEVWTPEALGYANDVKSAEYVEHAFGWSDRLEEILLKCSRRGTVPVFEGQELRLG